MTSADAGYSTHPGVFAAAEVGTLLEAIAAQSITWSRAGARHVLDCAPITAIARDVRLLVIASQWLRGPAVPFKATIFDKNPEANWLVAWHQDTALPLAEYGVRPGWGPWSNKSGVTYAHAPASALERVIALRLHLDDSTADNGPLRVLPGTHRFGVLTDAEVHQHAQLITPVECRAAAGDVIAMSPLIIHASSKCANARARRVLHIEYAASMEIAPGVLLRAA